MAKKPKREPYSICLYLNKKKVKTYCKNVRFSTVLSKWKKLKSAEQPPFIKLIHGKRLTPAHYELVLIGPVAESKSPIYIKDELGRNIEATLDNPNLAIKRIMPYWYEELIYDYETKNKITYDKVLEYILSINEIGQIFTLNNKLFIQVDDNIKVYGNRNLADSQRLFEILKNDLINRKVFNFIFVKDVSRHQRTLLYDLLETKGFTRAQLFKHYSR